LSKDSARASAPSLSTPYKKTIDFQSSNSHQSVNSFLFDTKHYKKKMAVIHMLLILTTIWSRNTARSNSYYYEDYDYLSREAWLDEVGMKRDQVQTHAMIREMFQLTERQDEMLVSERLFRTFCDMCM
jgi:hypothetical protein